MCSRPRNSRLVSALKPSASAGQSGVKASGRPSSRPPLRRRVLLVDDHPLMRVGLRELIGGQADLEVCGEAGSPGEAMTLLERVKPDLVVTDITMPGRGGVEFIKDVLALRPELPILVLSLHDETIYAERVLRAGARRSGLGDWVRRGPRQGLRLPDGLPQQAAQFHRWGDFSVGRQFLPQQVAHQFHRRQAQLQAVRETVPESGLLA